MDSESRDMVPNPKRRNPIRIFIQGRIEMYEEKTICLLYPGKSPVSSK